MKFDYDQQFHESLADEFDFAGLIDRASLWCETNEDAMAIKVEFNEWAFLNRSPLIASVRKTSISDTRKKKGFRVWILTNIDGPEAYMVDAVKAWAKERLEFVSGKPEQGWPMTREVYSDFIAWAKERELRMSYLPAINVFSSRLKGFADIKRAAAGSFVVGVILKPVRSLK